MSALPLKNLRDLANLASICNVDERTARRWCEKGIVPGAYRAKKGRGHWRIRNIYTAAASLFDRTKKKGFRQSRKAKNRLSSSEQTVSRYKTEIANLQSPRNLASRLYFAFKHQETPEEMMSNVRAHTSEAKADFWRKPLAELYKEIPAVLWKAARDPRSAHLYFTASKLRFEGGQATAQALASKLGISRASLYRNYTPQQIQGSLCTVWQKQTPAKSIEHKKQARKLFHEIGKNYST